jgi:hypothetical protein
MLNFISLRKMRDNHIVILPECRKLQLPAEQTCREKVVLLFREAIIE